MKNIVTILRFEIQISAFVF